MEYLKNPIIIGLIVSGGCYLYLKWSTQKKREENPKKKVAEPKMLYSILLGIVVFLGVSLWLNTEQIIKSDNIQIKVPIDISSNSPIPIIPSFSKQAIPNVFIETA
jgi:hypothetical protein